MTATVEAPIQKNAAFAYRIRLKNGKIETGNATHRTRESLITMLAQLPNYETILALRETGASKVGRNARPKTRSTVVFPRMLDLCMSVGLDPLTSIEADVVPQRLALGARTKVLGYIAR